LTFDEFGMWVRLGGAYWQRASLDAIGVLAALLGLIAYAPTLKRFRPRHWWSAVIMLIAVAVFFVMLAESFRHARRIIGPPLHQLETASPP
jgi:nitrate/nitrite transporter NarK